MPRIQYKCVCDMCKLEIQSENNENDVALNTAKYVYCGSCYQDLLSWWECWKSGNWTVVWKVASK
jgi:hypothetical protein